MAGAAISSILTGIVAVQDMVLYIQQQTLQEAVKAHPNLSDAIILLKVDAPLTRTAHQSLFHPLVKLHHWSWHVPTILARLRWKGGTSH